MKKIATIFMILALLSIAFADVNVTFRVNTSTSPDGSTDSTCVIHVRGDMNSWGDGNPLTNVGGDYWETTIVLAAGTYGYKFTYTDNVTGGVKWEDNIGGNRSVTVGDADTILQVVYFDDNDGAFTPTDSVDVWFRVSTAGIIGYDGDTLGVRGSGGPLDWGTSIKLIQEGDTEFWSGLISFSNSEIGNTAEYKFLQDDGWESVDNRTFVIGADTTLAFKYFSDQPPVSDIQTYNVTIVMNTSTMDNVTDSTALFFVTGGYDGWVHDDDTLTQIGDYCSKTFAFQGPGSGLDLEFTFFYKMLATIDQQNWQGGDNLTPTITSDTTLVYYWQNGATPPYVETDSIDVWFRVNMAGVASFDSASNIVGVRGAAPLDWGNTYELTQEGDSWYWSGQFSFSNDLAGSNQEYKFVWGDTPNWESVDNRSFVLKSDTTLAFKYFNNEPPTEVEPQTAAVVFSVDMAAYLDLGLFSEARKDSMQVRGGFNGWNDGDPLKCKMTKQPGTSLYTLIAQITDFPDKEIEYKYYMKMSQESIDYWKTQGISDIAGDWGYEVPPTRGGGNRLLTFEGDPANYQILEVEAYNGLPLQGIIPAGSTVPVTFSINMSAAPGFNSATDSVMFNFKDEWQVNALSLRDSVLEYTDDNSDGTYEITIDFFGPTAYTLIYTVSFAGPEGATEEGGGFEFGRFRCRYIQPATLDPVSWPTAYTCPADVFTEDPPLDVENPPLGVVKIDDEVVVPERFVLEQNFPNPFNPTTEIRFSMQRSDNVTLTVFNMLGQMVTKAVYSNLQVGQYTYMWNGTDMSGNSVASGVYFYELQVGNQFRDIKKMVLMK